MPIRPVQKNGSLVYCPGPLKKLVVKALGVGTISAIFSVLPLLGLAWFVSRTASDPYVMFTIGIFFVFAAAFAIAFRRLMRRGIRVESGKMIDDRKAETVIVHLDQLDSLLMHLSPVEKEPEPSSMGAYLLKGFRRIFLWTVTAKSGESEIEFYEDDFGSEMLMSQILGPSHLAHFRKAEPDQASGKRTYWAPPVLSLSGAGVLLLQLLIRLWLERTPDPTSITLNWLALLVLLIPSLASWITLDEDRFQWWIMGIPVTVMR